MKVAACTTTGSLNAIVMAALLFSCSNKKPPEAIIREYLHAKNSHQVSTSMQYIADDAVLEIPGLGMIIKGKEKRREIAEYDSVLNTTLTPSDLTVRGDTVFCSVIERNDWLEAAGIPSVYYPSTMHVVKDGKIVYSSGRMADTSAAEIGRVLGEFVPWGNENHPETMSRMMPGGIFIYNAQNGETVVGLLRQWREAAAGESPD
jgi:ketosteroid isomerase-like protein